MELMNEQRVTEKKEIEASKYSVIDKRIPLILTIERNVHNQNYDLFLYHLNISRSPGLFQGYSGTKRSYKEGVSLEEAKLVYNVLSNEDDFEIIKGWGGQNIFLTAVDRKSKGQILEDIVTEVRSRFSFLKPIGEKFFDYDSNEPYVIKE